MVLDHLDKRSAIIAASAASSIITLVGSVVAYNLFNSWKASQEIRKIKGEANATSPIPLEPKKQTHAQELIDEQLARNRAFLGDEAMNTIRNANVIVVGAGGVGSWAATMLVRSGVGKVRIIDFDQVTLSSLNRHACATLEDVGTPKVECCAKFLRKVAPFVEIEPVVALWTKEQAGDLLSGNPTYVIDCIDNIDTKVDLLEYCYSVLKCPVISAMGAGCKADPTRVRIADISMSIEDPLSRSVRRRLRLKGIVTGIPVIFSGEKPGKDKAKLLELDDSEFEKGKVDELSVLKDFRVRILPVLGPLPAIFGLTIATHILNELGKYNPVFDPLLGGYSMAGKARNKLYTNAVQGLVSQVARMGWSDTVPVDTKDCGYLIEEVFRGKSVIDGEFNRIVLTKWNPAKPLSMDNIVTMSKEQQASHEAKVLKKGPEGEAELAKVYSAEVLRVVEQRLEEQRWYSQFR